MPPQGVPRLSEWLTPTKMKDVYVVPFVTDLPTRKLHEGLDSLP